MKKALILRQGELELALCVVLLNMAYVWAVRSRWRCLQDDPAANTGLAN